MHGGFMKLIVVRHGQTQWNKQKRLQGKTDIPLNDHGIGQAKALAQALKNFWLIDRIITSPLKRAKETAAFCAKLCDRPLEIDERLTEIDFGEWEGLTFDQICVRYPLEMSTWEKSPETCEISGAKENVADVHMRVNHFFDEMASINESKTVLCVSHSFPVKLLIARALELPMSGTHHIALHNTSINVIQISHHQTILHHLNLIDHLDKNYSTTFLTLGEK